MHFLNVRIALKVAQHSYTPMTYSSLRIIVNSFGNFVLKEKGRKVKIEENILNLVCMQFITCAFFS